MSYGSAIKVQLTKKLKALHIPKANVFTQLLIISRVVYCRTEVNQQR